MDVSFLRPSITEVPDPFLLELKEDLTLMQDACGNLAQGFDSSISALLPMDLELPAGKIHRASEVLLDLLTPRPEPRKLRGDSVITDSSEELQSPTVHVRRLSTLSAATSPHLLPRQIPTLEQLVISIDQLDHASSSFFPASPEATEVDSGAFIASANKTLILVAKALYELRGSASPIVMESKEVASAVAAPAPFALPKAKMGVVDDDTAVRSILSKRFLSDYKTGDIPMAVDGISAVDGLLTCEGKTLEILFLDNFMPGRTGAEIIRLIRSNPEWSKIVVVFLTTDDSFNVMIEQRKSDGSVERLPKWKTLGFDAYLIKPIKKTDLAQCLKETYQRLFRSTDPLDERRWITNNRECAAAASVEKM